MRTATRRRHGRRELKRKEAKRKEAKQVEQTVQENKTIKDKCRYNEHEKHENNYEWKDTHELTRVGWITRLQLRRIL